MGPFVDGVVAVVALLSAVLRWVKSVAFALVWRSARRKVPRPPRAESDLAASVAVQEASLGVALVLVAWEAVAGGDVFPEIAALIVLGYAQRVVFAIRARRAAAARPSASASGRRRNWS